MYINYIYKSIYIVQISLCTYVSFFRVEIHYLNIEMNSRHDIEVVDRLLLRDLFRMQNKIFYLL